MEEMFTSTALNKLKQNLKQESPKGPRSLT